MNIVVLAGGLSPEREVSLTSGQMVCAALRRCGHRVLLLDVWRGLSDREVGDDPMALFCGAEACDDLLSVGAGRIGAAAPDVEALRRLCGETAGTLVGEHVLQLCRLADLVFPVLHGAMGENGQLQAMLDNFGVCYTGSGFAGSFLAMEKPLGKLVMRQNGLTTPDWCEIDANGDGTAACERIAAEVGFPCVIKPCDGGSSVGVTMVDDRDELATALDEARRFGTRVMAERRVAGRELSVAIVGDRALPAIEIIPRRGFYDYRNKYDAGRTREQCPAPLTEEQSARLAAEARQAFAALRLRDYARGDYILDEQGTFWCLEWNTLPGMTPTSLLPQEARAAGMDYDALCERIVQMAAKRRDA